MFHVTPSLKIMAWPSCFVFILPTKWRKRLSFPSGNLDWLVDYFIDIDWQCILLFKADYCCESALLVRLEWQMILHVKYCTTLSFLSQIFSFNKLKPLAFVILYITSDDFLYEIAVNVWLYWCALLILMFENWIKWFYRLFDSTHCSSVCTSALSPW